jgi:hypothetical protein
MAELRLDVLRMCPLGDQEAGVRVAQVVEPDASEIGATQRPSPLPLDEVVGLDRLAVRAAEDQATLEPAREPSQRRPQRGRQVDRAAGSAATSV